MRLQNYKKLTKNHVINRGTKKNVTRILHKLLSKVYYNIV